ncbi:hypothetical protein [Streptosporangium carneum]|uniref:Uncharacterized protein n=1 Tax=Streptosporangium carneum TaxID=47481 RepID=A0A9W6I7V6_9ACTN|nr:hypothetical protein [Streptosporangium carneum]GLK12559.1 hypothetical protein GCM10017600_59690 [Streptosporangium carneum]
MTRVRTAVAALAAALVLTLPAAAPASADQYQPVETVHTERVRVGPYDLTVGFSTWPLHAMRSLDFTFVPDGGITGKSGTLTLVGPPGARNESSRLSRHPRKRDVWGLDIQALNTEGPWTLRFELDGASGRGVGELRGLTVLEQPGPPLLLSWAISVLPLIGVVVFLGVALHRTRLSPA